MVQDKGYTPRHARAWRRPPRFYIGWALLLLAVLIGVVVAITDTDGYVNGADVLVITLALIGLALIGESALGGGPRAH